MQPIAADKQICVTLTAAEWNQALWLMREAPIAHRIADPIINGLGAKIQASAEASEMATMSEPSS